VAAYKCFRQAANTQHSLEVCELLFSSFHTYMNSHFNSNVLIFLIAHFNTIVTTFRDRLARQLSPLPYYCADHCQQKQALFSCIKAECLQVKGMRQTDRQKLLQLLSVLHTFQKHMHFGKINRHAFCSSWGDFIFLISVFCKLLEQNMQFTLIMGYYTSVGFMGPT